MMSSKTPFTISRTFNAPQSLVWKVYTEAEHLKQWWGPKEMKVTYATMDFRVGGMFHYGLSAPDGSEMWGRFIYREIDPISRMTFVASFSDPQGNITRHTMAPTWPAETMCITAFSEKDGKTTVELTAYPINAKEEEEALFFANFDSMNGGYGGTFERLDQYLASLKS